MSTTYPPSTYFLHTTCIAIRYSLILTKCPNHLNTLWSTLLTSSYSIPPLLCTSSFLTLSFVTLPPNFSNPSSLEYLLSFSHHFSFFKKERKIIAIHDENSTIYDVVNQACSTAINLTYLLGLVSKQLRLLRDRVEDSTTLVNSMSPKMS